MRNLDCHQGTFTPQGGIKQNTPQGGTKQSPGFTSRLPGLVPYSINTVTQFGTRKVS